MRQPAIGATAVVQLRRKRAKPKAEASEAATMTAKQRLAMIHRLARPADSRWAYYLEEQVPEATARLVDAMLMQPEQTVSR
jgi:sarcosine oxidase gamma subunit